MWKRLDRSVWYRRCESAFRTDSRFAKLGLLRPFSLWQFSPLQIIRPVADRRIALG
jgi:hypothetical protein